VLAAIFRQSGKERGYIPVCGSMGCVTVHVDLIMQSQLVKYRDIFVVGCLTGFRFSDYSNLQFEEFRNGMLHVIQKKMLAPVVVPLRVEARAILVDKYEMRIPKISHVKFTNYTKGIVRLACIREPVKMTHKKE
jgi:integrase